MIVAWIRVVMKIVWRCSEILKKTVKADQSGFADVCGMWEKDRYKDLGLRNWKEGADSY